VVQGVLILRTAAPGVAGQGCLVVVMRANWGEGCLGAVVAAPGEGLPLETQAMVRVGL